jgi:flagellar protein FliT
MTNDVLDRAYSLTQAIESAAAQGDWLQAATHADERSPLLMSLQREQTPQALALIREIQRIDAAVAQRAQTGQEQLVTQHNESLKKIQATSLYHKTGML